MKPKRCLITNKPSVRAASEVLLSTSKLKQPDAQENLLSGSVPSTASCASLNPSPSSSVSALLPIPSESVSRVSEASLGKASPLSPTPSESVSVVSVASRGNRSRLSATPSLSESEANGSRPPRISFSSDRESSSLSSAFFVKGFCPYKDL